MDILCNKNAVNSLFNDKQFYKEFKAMLHGIIDDELAKDIDDMDCDLIDECTNMLIELEQDSDDGLAVIIPPIKAKAIISACSKRNFKSLSWGMRASVIACLIILSTITCNAAIYQATGRNIAQEIATSIGEKLSDWGIISFAEEKDKIVDEIPSGNENINDDFEGVTEPATGNENVNDDFEEPATTPVTKPGPSGNESIEDDFDDVTEPATGNENIEDDFDDESTTQAPSVPDVPSVEQYTISFDSAGGSAIAPRLVSYGKPIGALPIPEREGYVFTGWYNIDISYKYTSSFGGALTVKEAVPITRNTIYNYKGDAVLTARWEEAYTITFDPMDGTCDVKSMTVNSEGKLPYLPIPEKEGYAFEYWYYKSGFLNLTENRVDENTVYTANTTLYARYAVDETEFKLYFYDNTGSRITPQGIEYLPIRYGEPYGELPVPEAPDKDMIFIGWFDGFSLASNQVTADTIHSSRSDKGICALWAYDIYTIHFDTDGGNYIEPQNAYPGHVFGNLPTSKKEGYKFRCWTYNGKDVKADTDVPDLSGEGTKELTLKASWEAIKVEIFFDGNGGDVRKSNSRTYQYGSPFNEFPEVTRAGYDFAGWYTDPEDGELITADSIVKFTESTVLYAHWKENEEQLVYVTFHNNRSVEDTYTVAYEPGTIFGINPAPGTTTSSEGLYTRFLGWYDDKYYGDEVTADTVITEDMHVYAHWGLSSIAASLVKIKIDNVKPVYELNEQINFDEIQVYLTSNGRIFEDLSFNELIEALGETMEEHFDNADTSTYGEHTMTFKFAMEEFDLIGLGTLYFEQSVTYMVVSDEHPNTYIRNYKEPTCTAKGYTGDVVCKDCGYIIEYGEEIE